MLTSVQKAAWLEWQLRQATSGNRDTIACPYCGLTVVLGVERLCCGPMNDVTAKLLESMESTGSDGKDAEESSEIAGANAAALRNSDNFIQ